MVLSAVSPEVLAPSKIRVVLSAWSPGIPSQTGSLFSMRDFRGFARFFARNGCSISHPFFCKFWISTVFMCFFGRYSCSHMPESTPGFLEFPRAMHALLYRFSNVDLQCMSGKSEGSVRIFGKVSLLGFCSRFCALQLSMTLHVNARWWGDQAHQVVSWRRRDAPERMDSPCAACGK